MKTEDLTPTEIKEWANSRLDRPLRRKLQAKYKDRLRQTYSGLDKKGQNEKIIDFFADLNALAGEGGTQRASPFAQTGSIFYELMNKLSLVDAKGKALTKNKFEQGSGIGLRGRIRVKSPDLSIFSNERGVMFTRKNVEQNYQEYLTSLEKEKRENVISTVQKIKNAMKDTAAVERAKKRSKLIRIDKSKFLGATDFSKASTRERVYDFWESVAPKYKKVQSTLNKLLTEATNTDVYALMLEDVEKETAKLESIEDKESKEFQAQQIVLQDVKTNIERKKSQFDSDLSALKQQIEKANLEYLVRIDKVKVPFKVGAWDRMLDAIARYENAESVIAFGKEKGKETSEEGQGMRTMEEAAMAGYYAGETDAGGKITAQPFFNAPSKDDEYSGATMQDASIGEEGFQADDSIVEDAQDRLQRASTEGLDPLLAIESIGNKKLISLDEESKTMMQELVKELRQGTDLEFISQADKWLDELEESYLLDRDTYVLPMAVFKSERAQGLKIKTLPTATEGKNYSTTEDEVEIVDEVVAQRTTVDGKKEDITEAKAVLKPKGEVITDLNGIFDAIHTLFVSERYSFLRYSRTDVAGRTTVERRDAQKLAGKASVAQQKVLRLFTEGRRKSPTIPARKGRLISGVSDTDVGKALGEFIIACNEYYFEPFLKGITPLAYPRFMSGAGIKALTALADELGYETMSGNVARRLSGVANVQLTSGQMASLTKFLTKMDEVVVVELKTIDLAEKAAKVLTKIFGEKEKNLDTVSAILYHFMEQTKEGREHNLASRKMKGDDETIRSRAKSFGKSKNPMSYPIFALYLFLETNQGLLTRNKALDTQYQKLMKTLTEVEDEMPEILNKLLKAHNEIRKALGKEVVRPRFRFNHEGFDNIVDLMHKQQGIDLSHLEVENIVKTVDSHASIGKEYGITEEQVYLIKAHVR